MYAQYVDFNSRAREGATGSGVLSLVLFATSIHAPVRVRPVDGGGKVPHADFNSRAREGATLANHFKHMHPAGLQFTRP